MINMCIVWNVNKKNKTATTFFGDLRKGLCFYSERQNKLYRKLLSLAESWNAKYALPLVLPERVPG